MIDNVVARLAARKVPHSSPKSAKAISGLLLPVALFAGLHGAEARLWAQGATTGAIGGTVRDAVGGLLPNATVEIISNDTKATRTLQTDGSGEYRVTELQPGAYTVIITAAGFKTERQVAVVVAVGELANVSPNMTLGDVTNTVEVSGEEPLMHTESNDFSSVIDQSNIDNLPINGRRWSNFALLTPGVVSNADGFGLLSFRGISYLLNNNTVDGADDNQAYFSEARGRTRASYAVSQGAVQEFQVNTSNYSAEYGRAAGGVVNTITKSGTNSLHGELYFYDRDNSIGGATNPYTLLTTETSAGTYVTTPYKPTDWRKQYGFGVGGPILRDRLFWFYAFDQQKRNFPGTARASDPQDTFAAANPFLPAGETCTILPNSGTFTAANNTSGVVNGAAPGATVTYTLSQTATPSSNTNPAMSGYPIRQSFEGDFAACALAEAYQSTYQAGAAYYTQGLGVLNSELGTVPRFGDQEINFPKLDWRITNRQTLTLQYNRLRWDSPAGLQTQASNFYGRDSFGNDFVKVDAIVGRLSSVISSSMVNAFLVQYGRDFEYETSQPPLPNELPLSNNRFNRPPEVQIGYSFDNQGFNIGKSDILERRALPDERRTQFKDDFSWTHGQHNTKFGLDYNDVSDYINNLYNENGYYSYDYSYDFIADYLHAVNGLGGANYAPLYYSYSQGFGSPGALIATRDYAGYATDDWRITPTLTLTLGLRYEYQYVPANPTPNPAYPATLDRPDDRNNVGPRFGFAWNVFGNGKTTLRGGYGLYYGRIPNANILQTYLESGGPNAQINYTSLYYGAGRTYPTFPNIYTAASQISTNYVSSVAYLDPHLQNPQVHEVDLALEQDLGKGFILGLTYMDSLGRELDSSDDVNLGLGSAYPFTYTVADAAAPALTGYTTFPHGGAPPPLPNGYQFTTNIYGIAGSSAPARPNTNFGQILRIASNVNSSYNALAAQLNKRFSHGFSLLSNYTWAHALDYNPYVGTGVPSITSYDPNNLRLDYGNSSLNVPNRLVVATVYEPGLDHTWGQGLSGSLRREVLGGWRIAPTIQAQNGLPFTPTVSGSPSGLTVPAGVAGCQPAAGATTCPFTELYKGVNGSDGVNRIVVLGRNHFQYPETTTVDLRLAKNFAISAPHVERARLELLVEAFNLFNHQNITSISTGSYSISGTTLTSNPNFDTYLNSNSNTVYSQRQLQLAARLHF